MGSGAPGVPAPLSSVRREARPVPSRGRGGLGGGPGAHRARGEGLAGPTRSGSESQIRDDTTTNDGTRGAGGTGQTDETARSGTEDGGFDGSSLRLSPPSWIDPEHLDATTADDAARQTTSPGSGGQGSGRTTGMDGHRRRRSPADSGPGLPEGFQTRQEIQGLEFVRLDEEPPRYTLRRNCLRRSVRAIPASERDHSHRYAVPPKPGTGDPA